MECQTVGPRSRLAPKNLQSYQQKTLLSKDDTSRHRVEKDIKYHYITGLDKDFFYRKIVNIFLPISFNICCGLSKEPSH